MSFVFYFFFHSHSQYIILNFFHFILNKSLLSCDGAIERKIYQFCFVQILHLYFGCLSEIASTLHIILHYTTQLLYHRFDWLHYLLSQVTSQPEVLQCILTTFRYSFFFLKYIEVGREKSIDRNIKTSMMRDTLGIDPATWACALGGN